MSILGQQLSRGSTSKLIKFIIIAFFKVVICTLNLILDAKLNTLPKSNTVTPRKAIKSTGEPAFLWHFHRTEMIENINKDPPIFGGITFHSRSSPSQIEVLLGKHVHLLKSMKAIWENLAISFRKSIDGGANIPLFGAHPKRH